MKGLPGANGKGRPAPVFVRPRTVLDRITLEQAAAIRDQSVAAFVLESGLRRARTVVKSTSKGVSR